MLFMLDYLGACFAAGFVVVCCAGLLLLFFAIVFGFIFDDFVKVLLAVLFLLLTTGLGALFLKMGWFPL